MTALRHPEGARGPCPRGVWSRHARRLVAAALGIAAVAIVAASGLAQAATYPAGFQESTVFSGLTHPTVVRFASDGRVFVAEKGGVVKVFQSLTDTNPPTVFADLHVAVHDYWDRGLLGLALHPNFPATPYVYVLYTLNKKPGGTIPSWSDAQGNDTCPDKDASNNVIGPGATVDGCAVTARLSRLTASGSTMVPGSEVVLLETWCQQFPSHSIGTLQFGPEGALYVSAGEGSNFLIPDWGQFGGTRPDGQGGFYTQKNVCGDPPGGVGDPGNLMNAPNAEGGALRAQSVRRTDGPALLNGSLLRIDPATTAGWPTNPLHASSDANAKRIVAYGLRNPFRFTLRPGTSEVWVGDVGWDHWEEIDRVPDPTAGPVNFGWPCYEGGFQGGAGVSLHQSGYESAGLGLCNSLYAPGDANVKAPVFAYLHSDQVVGTDTCAPGSSSVAGLAFYTANSYPAAYQGALFFTDYSRRCIWAMPPGVSGDPDPTQIVPFGQGLSGGSVDLEIGPGGDLFFVDYDGGNVKRVQYFSGNVPPTAVATADVTSGALPLTVHFSAAGSSDPNDAFGTLTFEWDLDGNGSYETTGVSPTKVYSAAGPVTVHLRVTDPHGGQGTASLLIKPGNLAPSITTFTPTSGLTWKVGDTIPFSATATDPEDGGLPASAFSWSIVMHHCPSNCHLHTVQTISGAASGSFTAPDHEYPSYLEIQLTVTDSGGLTATQSVSLQPQTVDLSFVSDPPGLSLGVNAETGAAPFTRTVIVGSATAVTAPSPQTPAANTYNFLSWSDGGAQNHSVTAPASPATYTATFTLEPVADLSVVNSDGLTLVKAGDHVTYVITVANAGPFSVTDATVTDAFPAALTNVSWTCVGALGGACAAAGSGNIGTQVGLPVGGSVRFTASATVSLSAVGPLANTASVSPPAGTLAGTPANDSMTDVDDVIPALSEVHFSAPNYSVVEGGTATITVSRPSASSALDVDYVLSDGTAHAGVDYQAASPRTTGLLRFKKGSKSQTIEVKTLPNTLADGERTVLLSLQDTGGTGYLGELATSVLTIKDNDVAGAIRFGAGAYAANEGNANALVKITRTGGSASGATVDFTATSDGTPAGGTATPGVDYTEVLARPVVFAAGQTSQNVAVPILDDGVPGGHKTVDLSLSTPTGGASLGAPSEAVLTIAEDNPVIQFSAANFSASESASKATITVKRSGPTADVVTVHYSTADGNAVAGTDYTATSGNLTFAKGVTSRTFVVPLVNDSAHEPGRIVNLTLTDPPVDLTNPGQAALGQQSTAVLTINDTDPTPTVRLGAAAYNVAETAGTAKLEVKRIGAAGSTVTVDYATSNGSAVEGTNYTAAMGTLTFDPGVVSLTVPVTIQPSLPTDGNLAFNLTLSNAHVVGNGQAQVNLGAPSTAVVTILSTDPLVQFSAAAYKVSEVGPKATITVKRSGPMAGTVKVSYADAGGGSASSPQDYSLTEGTLTFGPNVATRTFDVMVTDSGLVQKDKTVNLLLKLPDGAGIGARGTATLTLVADDPSVAFSKDGFVVAESGKKATITLKRTGNKNVAFTVPFSASGGTAQPGVDYTPVNTTIAFAKGAVSRSVVVPVLENTLADGPRTVNLALGAPDLAVKGTPDTAALLITDDDVAGSIQFAAADYSVGEAGSTAVITLARTGGSASAATVHWATSDGTATSPTNYAASSGTVTFDAGQTSAVFAVDVHDDAVHTGSLTVKLTLDAPGGGATLGPRQTATLWIVDAE